jgi:hypothetical protein
MEEAKRAKLNLEGFRHTIDGSAIRHILKHSDSAEERQRGNISVTDADFEFIPDILNAPDKMIYGMKNDIGQNMVVYLKAMPDGSVLYLEEVRTGRKTLTAQSMRKYPQTTSADSIIKSLRPTSETLPGDKFIVVDRPEVRNLVYEQSLERHYQRQAEETLGSFSPSI